MSRLTRRIIDICGSCDQQEYCRYTPNAGNCYLRQLHEKLKRYEDLEEQGRLIEREYATIVGESGICSECGESYMDVADADAFQSGYIPNFCPWCGAIFVSEAKLAELNNRDAINTEVNYSDAINVYRELNTHDREKSVSELAELKEQI